MSDFDRNHYYIYLTAMFLVFILAFISAIAAADGTITLTAITSGFIFAVLAGHIRRNHNARP